MKYLLPIVLIVIAGACKKEYYAPIPHLKFTPEDKKWFTYGIGQQLKFKNDKGDSLVYMVTLIEQSSVTPQYKDTTWAIEAYSESYLVKLTSATDSIRLYFYKEYSRFRDPDKMQHTILLTSMRGQLVKLAAIENNASFNYKTVNGVTYTTVTPAIPSSDQINPWTKWDKAWYDQGAGFIELIDLNGVSWKRV